MADSKDPGTPPATDAEIQALAARLVEKRFREFTSARDAAKQERTPTTVDIRMDRGPGSYWLGARGPRELVLPWANPTPLPGEVELARIYESFSMMGDTHSVRAWRREEEIGYRVLNDQGDPVEVVFERSSEPLILGEVVRLIDSMYGDNDPPELDLAGYEGTLGFFERGIAWNYDGDRPAAELVSRSTISSRFYPELAPYYEGRKKAFTDWLFAADPWC